MIFLFVVFTILSTAFYYLTTKIAPIFHLNNRMIIVLLPMVYVFAFIAHRVLIEAEVFGLIGITIMRINYFILGLAFLLLPIFLLLDIGRLVLKISATVVKHPIIAEINHIVTHKNAVLSAMGLALFLSLLATFNFHRDIEVEYISIKSNKVTTPQTFLHITDLQLGSVSPQHVEKIRDKILETVALLQANGTVINGILNTGDHIDSANYQISDLAPLAVNQTANLPQYFSLGNHEFYHQTSRILKQLDQLGIKVLRDKNASFGQLNIIGIDDAKIHTLSQQEHLIDPTKFNVLLYHRPDLPINLKQLGIDLVLSGHTHGGQIFPYTLGLKLLYNAPQGLSNFHGTAAYVSDGIGLWGPLMRLGSKNQFAVITIEPEL